MKKRRLNFPIASSSSTAPLGPNNSRADWLSSLKRWISFFQLGSIFYCRVRHLLTCESQSKVWRNGRPRRGPFHFFLLFLSALNFTFPRPLFRVHDGERCHLSCFHSICVSTLPIVSNVFKRRKIPHLHPRVRTDLLSVALTVGGFCCGENIRQR